VETFEQRLEDAQRSLNIQPRDFIPVMYMNETSIATEIYKFAPTLLVIGAFILMGRMMGGASGMGGGSGGGISNIFRMTRSPAKRITKENVSTSFKDVAGCDEAKREIMEFVEFLKDSKKFTDLGAKIPRGALLTGPPGTGKTLLAKATAGEANVPFFSVSGSDFVEMFVGLGASRVRELFKEAKAEAPCIIFIDEIDAIGRKRGRSGMTGGNDERENTLNQLLVEMDGFDSNTNIVILAGTNRLDVLDPALTRPGRFDRTITVDKPDVEGRKGIFQVHLKNIVIEGDREQFATRMAALTPGFVGADIANICNEAAIIAARANKKQVDLKDFEAATDRVIGGLESRKLISPEEKKVIAYHEAGHAIAGWNLEHADPLLKVTIVPRGNGALGFAQYLPKEIFLRTKEQILDIVCMALAGRASEQVNFGKVTTGASDDLRRVTQIVYQMVQIYGMNDRVGQLAFPRGDGGMMEEKMYSNATAEMMDEEVRKIVEEAYNRTLTLIQEKREQVRLIAELLIEKETITNMDVAKLIGKRPYSAGKEYDRYAQGYEDEPATQRQSEDKQAEEAEKKASGNEDVAVVV
jgi:AFG3 family protein